MKKFIFGLLLTFGYTSLASAYVYSGTLGSSATATDKWYFICQSPTVTRMYFQVSMSPSTSTSPCVKVSNTNVVPNKVARSCDYIKQPWNGVSITTGPGPNFFTISKVAKVGGTSTGSVSYSVRANCVNSDGLDGLSSPQNSVQVYIQNQ